jgi:pantoate kinase
MFDGVVWVARFERVSKKKATRMLLERGFSRWFNEKIKEDRALRKLEDEPHLTRFILQFRRFAREHGMDISKFKF